MSDWKTTGVLALGCLVTVYVGRRALRSRNSYPLPPGPPGLPWVGNVIGVNADAPWLTYTEWARTYGDLVYSRLFGKDVIIINSEKIVKDLFENRSKNYSDRPFFVTNEMCGVDYSTVFTPYGDKWRMHRQFFHQTFRPEAVNRFLPYQQRRACHLLRRLFEAPEQLSDHVFEYTAAVVLNSAYDYDPAFGKDEFVDMIAQVLHIATPLLRPDIGVIFGAFPWLRYLPSWFPGMSFTKEMALARAYSKMCLDRLLEYSVRKMLAGSVGASIVHDALRRAEENGVSPQADELWMTALKEASGTAFLAASETSNSFLMTFFLMMLVHPAIQEKAQAQIDTVVGRDRLPEMDDRPLLPFIDAIFRETLRYNPVAPLSVPHVSVADDVYDGYHIPKGAMLVPNVWLMAHDESRFPNSRAFIPERFLEDDGSLKPNDIEHIAFGYGRRICVGRHFADMSAWSVMAKVLAVFKILRPLDENGTEISVEPKFVSGLAVHPAPFKFRIVLRYPGLDIEKLEHIIAANTA